MTNSKVSPTVLHFPSLVRISPDKNFLQKITFLEKSHIKNSSRITQLIYFLFLNTTHDLIYSYSPNCRQKILGFCFPKNHIPEHTLPRFPEPTSEGHSPPEPVSPKIRLVPLFNLYTWFIQPWMRHSHNGIRPEKHNSSPSIFFLFLLLLLSINNCWLLCYPSAK